jgi:hypothetical protein
MRLLDRVPEVLRDLDDRTRVIRRIDVTAAAL